MGAYFGTDGIRGVAGELLTPEFAVQVGRAAAVVLAQKSGPHPLFVIGRDTRLSGPMLEAALTAGLTSGGARVEIAGVIPTPGLASLVHQRGADAGVVISASHNPFADNGIKFFSSAGTKLSDEEEAEIEAHIEHHDLQSLAGADFGSAAQLEGAVEGYVWDVVKRIPLDLSGMKIALDCAHGAMHLAAPLALEESGAHVTVLFDQPDGTNINAGCGSTHMGALQKLVADDGFDLGLAFDGDGDRVLAVDAAGNLVDGDFIIAILAKHLKSSGQAPRRHRRDHGHDQPGLPPGHEARGHPGARHPGRGPLRRRRDAQGRLPARRRAVRPHHQPRREHHRRRPGHGAPAPAGPARDGRAPGARRPR